MTPQGHSIKKFEAMAFGMSEEERIIDRILRFFFFFLDVDRKWSRQFPLISTK